MKLLSDTQPLKTMMNVGLYYPNLVEFVINFPCWFKEYFPLKDLLVATNMHVKLAILYKIGLAN